MVTLDDWSELITIDYNAGLGGEFFGFLLYEAIYKQSLYKEVIYNKFDFVEYDIFTCSDKNKKQILKKLWYLKKKYHNSIIPTEFLEDAEFIESYNEIFNNSLTFLEEYRNYVYENYGHRFDGTFKMSLFHDTYVNELNLKYKISLPYIFPKSKNIMLVCPDHYMFFSKFLRVVKIISHHSLTKSKKELKNYIDSRYDKFVNLNLYSFDNYPCLKIDMYCLLHDKKNYDKELSNLLEQKIILNQEKINEYAHKNINLFNQYGLDINCVYSKKYFTDKLVNFMNGFLNG